MFYICSYFFSSDTGDDVWYEDFGSVCNAKVNNKIYENVDISTFTFDSINNNEIFQIDTKLSILKIMYLPKFLLIMHVLMIFMMAIILYTITKNYRSQKNMKRYYYGEISVPFFLF